MSTCIRLVASRGRLDVLASGPKPQRPACTRSATLPVHRSSSREDEIDVPSSDNVLSGHLTAASLALLTAHMSFPHYLDIHNRIRTRIDRGVEDIAVCWCSQHGDSLP